MADRKRIEKADSRRRITRFDGKFSDYAAIRASSGIVIPEVKKVMLNRRKKNALSGIHRTNIIYPSEMAKADWCPRATYYRMTGLPDRSSSASFTLENVFAEGNAIHSKWQSWLSETGLLWGDWRCSRCSEYVKNSLKPERTEFGSCVGVEWIKLDLPIALVTGQYVDRLPANKNFPHDWKYKEVTLSSTSHKVSGHADGALVNHNCLIEIKSVGIGSLRFEAPKLTEENTYEVKGKKITDIEGIWKNLHRPLMSHIRQGNVYLWMAAEMGLPFDTIVFLYEFKPNQQVKEFSIKASTDILAPMLDTCSLIEYALTRGIPPVCPFGGCTQCESYEKQLKEEK